MQPATIIIALLALLCTSVTASAEIYRSTDDRGNPVYSDTATPGSQEVDLQQPNTTPAVEPTPPSRPQNADNNDSYAPRIRITQPSDGQVLPNGRLPTTVRIDSDLPLRAEHQLTLSIDGTLHTLSATTPTTHRIPLLSRGPHTLKATLKDANGKVLSSDSTHIIAHWPGG